MKSLTTSNILVAGIGTEVGKTIVSGILAMLMEGDYWKPIQCGNPENSDTQIIKNWLDPAKHCIHAPAYSLQAPLSPHQAAQLENISISATSIILPKTKRSLIIEGVGGIFVPLSQTFLTIDVFAAWQCKWVLVSKHYLGSINHTLLTIDALKHRRIPIIGLIFNGIPNPDSEAAILAHSQLPFLGRLLPENNIHTTTLQRYAIQWHQSFSQILP